MYPWVEQDVLEEEGFIVASDENQEWLLPWWWWGYSKHNSKPVTFVDLGLSGTMKRWCLKRGALLDLSDLDVKVKSQKNFFSPFFIEEWEKKYGHSFWKHRNAWFKKPMACLKTPYKTTVWMDLDCEIKGSLDAMFSLPVPFSGVSATSEYRNAKWVGVNSGVLVFQRGSTLIEDWARESLENSHDYAGDQDVLSALIMKKNAIIGDLPVYYNWSRFNQEGAEALVVHWHGEQGKSVIKEKMVFKYNK